MRSIDSAIVKKLYMPKARSHKGDNGELLIIGGSARYHGAPLMAARAASKIVDFVYFSSTPENNQLVRKMKQGLAEFIAVPRADVEKYASHSDCILMGPGLGLNRAARSLVNRLLKKFPEKKFVLDAGAIRLVAVRNLGPNCIVTPHRQEFYSAFKCAPTANNVQAMAKKYGCVIVLKGVEDIICGPSLRDVRTSLRDGDPGTCRVNKTGNAGMTKGGTGDVMAGLIAGLACKNDLFLAACAGVYVNGLAGDRLKRRVSYYFSASDLIQEVPKVLAKYIKG